MPEENKHQCVSWHLSIAGRRALYGERKKVKKPQIRRPFKAYLQPCLGNKAKQWNMEANEFLQVYSISAPLCGRKSGQDVCHGG